MPSFWDNMHALHDEQQVLMTGDGQPTRVLPKGEKARTDDVPKDGYVASVGGLKAMQAYTARPEPCAQGRSVYGAPQGRKAAGADYGYRSSTAKRAGADSEGRTENRYPTQASQGILGTKDYYRWRAEDFERRNPGKSAPDYYLGYGDKYAHRFMDGTRKNLSPEGQRWTDDTFRSLQNRLEIGLREHPKMESDPEKLKDYAFETHSDAYLQSGLKELPFGDILRIMRTVEKKDYKNLNAWKEIGDVAPSVIAGQAGRYLIDPGLSAAKPMLKYGVNPFLTYDNGDEGK